MSWKHWLCGVSCVALAWSQARAADPVVSSYSPASSGVVLAQAAAPTTPQTPPAPAPAPAQQPPQAPQTDAFSQAPPAGGEAAGAANPQMLGDSLSYTGGNSSRGGGTITTTSLVPVISTGPSGSSSVSFNASSQTRGLPIKALGGSSFKTSDNDSPRPEDRAFLATDYFTRVLHSVRDKDFGSPNPSVRLAREIFGFEKTFLDGNASLEFRVPFFQIHQTDGTDFSDIGDVTLIGKWAFINDRDDDGNFVMTLGTALTFPTGPNDVVAGTTINPFIFQPFFGIIYGSGDWYVHGFTELAIPFSDTVPTVLFNDYGVGYYAYRGDGAVRSIVPTVEGHLTTPFGKEGSNAFPVGVIDTFVVTGGVHFIFSNRSILTLGYEFPMTGPQPFESEYVLQFNYFF